MYAHRHKSQRLLHLHNATAGVKQHPRHFNFSTSALPTWAGVESRPLKISARRASGSIRGKAAAGLDGAACNNRLSCAFLKLRVHVWFTTHVALNLLSLCWFLCHSALRYRDGMEGFHSPKAIWTLFRVEIGTDLFSTLKLFKCRYDSAPPLSSTILWVLLQRCETLQQWECERHAPRARKKHAKVSLTDICTQTGTHSLTTAYSTHTWFTLSGLFWASVKHMISFQLWVGELLMCGLKVPLYMWHKGYKAYSIHSNIDTDMTARLMVLQLTS